MIKPFYTHCCLCAPLIGGFCLGSLGMAPEHGSTRHRSYFTLAEGDDAMETAEFS